MLAANRDSVLAQLQASTNELRWKELDNIVGRFQNIIAVTGLSAGFSFEAMVHLEIPPAEELNLEGEVEERTLLITRMVHAFFVLTSLSLILSLYVVSAATFAVSAGYRLALQGSGAEAVNRAVAVLLVEFRFIFVASAVAMVCFMTSAMTVVWIKLEKDAYRFEEVATTIFGLGLIVIFASLWRLQSRLTVPADEFVGGDVFIQTASGREVDFASAANNKEDNHPRDCGGLLLSERRCSQLGSQSKLPVESADNVKQPSIIGRISRQLSSVTTVQPASER